MPRLRARILGTLAIGKLDSLTCRNSLIHVALVLEGYDATSELRSQRFSEFPNLDVQTKLIILTAKPTACQEPSRHDTSGVLYQQFEHRDRKSVV